MQPRTTHFPQGTQRFWGQRSRSTRLVILGAIGCGIAVVASSLGLSSITAVGYPGIFLVGLLSSSSVFLPLPGLAGTCAVAILLNPFIVGIVVGIGESIGELTGYGIGYSTQDVMKGRRLYKKAERWMERRGVITVFIFAVIPNPFIDIIGLAAGAIRYPVRKFLITLMVARVLRGVAIAYGCHRGVELLPVLSL